MVVFLRDSDRFLVDLAKEWKAELWWVNKIDNEFF